MQLTPWSYSSKGTEFAHQTATIMWANMVARFGICASNDPASYTEKGIAQAYYEKHCDSVPELKFLFAIKNAGHGDAVRGARSKAEGVKPGVPDLCLPVVSDGLIGLYIEMKRPISDGKAKGRPSDVQKEWDGFLRHQGYMTAICYGWLEARNTLLSYMDR